MSSKTPITVAHGDGIGPEIMAGDLAHLSEVFDLKPTSVVPSFVRRRWAREDLSQHGCLTVLGKPLPYGRYARISLVDLVN